MRSTTPARRTLAAHRRRAGVVVPAALALLLSSVVARQGASATAAPAPTALPQAHVAVDFAASQGRLPRPERFNNFTRRNLFPQQRPIDAAYLDAQGLHGSIYRVWLFPSGPGSVQSPTCPLTTSTCTFSSGVNVYLRAASSVSDSILVNMKLQQLADPSRPGGALTPAEVKPIVKTILATAKAHYPKIKYIEPLNEPDAPGNRGFMTPALVYPYYKVVYQAVNELNDELAPSVPMQVGGPTLFEFDSTWIGRFLDDYAADTDPGKRLDFFSYHSYLQFGDPATLTNPEFYKDDPKLVDGQRPTLEAMMRARGIATSIPTFITESGMYPGPLTDDTATGATQPCPPAEGEPGVPGCDAYYTTDYIRQAAGQASLEYWYSHQRNTYVFNWTTRHSDNPRKDELVTRVPLGTSIPTNVFTPYGNMMLMQSKMKDQQVAAVSDGLGIPSPGLGVYAVAADDRSGASLMVWNYQGCGAVALGSPCLNNGSFRTTVDMAHLPSNLAGHTVTERVYRIDQTTSNYYATPATDPAHASLQQVAVQTITPGAHFSQQLDLGPNALYLVVLEPRV
jgi:hypothetical protein